MKNLILILLFTLTISCKKKETIQPPLPTPCITKSKVFEGKYVINRPNQDTITIAFDRNYCPDNNSNLYWIYDLNKAIQPYVTTHTLNLNYNYAITSNEDNKMATINGYNYGFVRYSSLNVIDIFLPNEGEFYFTKIN